MNESIRGVERVEASSHDASHSGVTSGELVIRTDPGIARPNLEDPLGPLRSVLRRWRLLAVLTLIGGVLGWASAVVATEADTAPVAVDHYEARHVLVIDNNVPDTQAILGVRNLNALAKRVTIGDVPQSVAERLGLDLTEASTQIRVLIRSDSESLDLVTIGETPAVAEELADVYAEEFLGYLNAEAEQFSTDAISSAELRLTEAEANLLETQRALESAIAVENQSAINRLEQDRQQFESARIFANAALLEARADGVPVVPIETLQSASGTAAVINESRFDALVDNAAIGQNVVVLFRGENETGASTGALGAVSERLPTGVLSRVAVGALLAFFTGVMIATFLNRVDNRVRSRRQVESTLDLPVIAEIPSLGRSTRRTPGVYSREHPRSRFAEQYRALTSTLGYARRARRTKAQVVLVTSPGPAEGKTTTVANLGAMLAESGDSVLLINCDFRRPRLHVMTGSDYRPRDLNSTPIPDVELISNVVENSDALPTEVIAAQRSIIKKAKRRYDLIIIDTAPVLATNDAVELLDLVDDVLLVTRAGKTTIQAADRAVELLERRRSHVLGVVITDVDARNSSDYYYYNGSYYEDDKRSFVRPRFPRLRRQVDIDLVDEGAEESVPTTS